MNYQTFEHNHAYTTALCHLQHMTFETATRHRSKLTWQNQPIREPYTILSIKTATLASTRVNFSLSFPDLSCVRKSVYKKSIGNIFRYITQKNRHNKPSRVLELRVFCHGTKEVRG
ncbi:hypothetical protein POTOM_036769 [Populus tomentosa]|uniref:Uncharacterized protein n=1 Tax=Populus tomentosa TaxID=118781 RepID=A0A8X7Z3H8_POPTO|nr:hypothetical protein POTOM_036769 [Populus tomentosa]